MAGSFKLAYDGSTIYFQLRLDIIHATLFVDNNPKLDSGFGSDLSRFVEWYGDRDLIHVYVDVNPFRSSRASRTSSTGILRTGIRWHLVRLTVMGMVMCIVMSRRV